MRGAGIDPFHLPRDVYSEGEGHAHGNNQHYGQCSDKPAENYADGDGQLGWQCCGTYATDPEARIQDRGHGETADEKWPRGKRDSSLRSE